MGYVLGRNYKRCIWIWVWVFGVVIRIFQMIVSKYEEALVLMDATRLFACAAAFSDRLLPIF